MKVFRLQDREATPGAPDPSAARTLPLPALVHSQVVALLHLLIAVEPPRPVVLDACGVRSIQPVAALLLASVLGHRSQRGAPVRIANLPFALRRQLERHPLARYAEDERTGAAAGA
jgi:hypothetical protein